MTFIPESVRFASESFGVVSAVIIAALAAIVMTGFWEFLTTGWATTRSLIASHKAQLATSVA